MSWRTGRAWGLYLAAGLWASSVAWGAPSSKEAEFATIRALLALPEDRVDLTKAKLTIDKLIDPTVDIGATTAQLDSMAEQVRATFPKGAASRTKLEALRSFLYDAGPGKQPFAYDLSDPLGRTLRTKLLTTYLATRRGNCISMPILFILLGQRLGLDVTAATAPLHVFVKYRDETGTWFNLETTSGAGFTSDSWIQKNMPMTSQALENGLYMRPLSKRETVSVMLETLVQWHRERGEAGAIIELAQLLLAREPKSANAMLHMGGAYYVMYQQEFVSRYPRRSDVPVLLRGRYRELEEHMALWRTRAEELGWRPSPDEEEDTR